VGDNHWAKPIGVVDEVAFSFREMARERGWGSDSGEEVVWETPGFGVGDTSVQKALGNVI